jgi:hypothetical protein
MAYLLVAKELVDQWGGPPSVEFFDEMLKLPYKVTGWSIRDPNTYQVVIDMPGVSDDQCVLPFYEKIRDESSPMRDDYRLVRIEVQWQP